MAKLQVQLSRAHSGVSMFPGASVPFVDQLLYCRLASLKMPTPWNKNIGRAVLECVEILFHILIPLDYVEMLNICCFNFLVA